MVQSSYCSALNGYSILSSTSLTDKISTMLSNSLTQVATSTGSTYPLTISFPISLCDETDSMPTRLYTAFSILSISLSLLKPTPSSIV
ncbi:hypothetical protein HanIR_Chr09g0396151 [Helianthus annuus]|nr:hypothetical protein HanIR_Chr09g0396151 [Helianthus annuus]